jgi:protease-4
MTTTKSTSFWKIFFAALLALVVGSILFWIITFGIIGSAFKTEPFTVKDKSVLHITLKEPIRETTSAKFNPNTFELDKNIGLADAMIAIEAAAEDKNISGIFIDISSASMGFATMYEFRESIENFKKSGKFVVGYNSGEAVTQSALLFSSVADENYIFPSSMVEFLGFGAELTYLKGMFDKLDVEMQVFRGEDNEFKSAVEPLFMSKMSDSSRLQTQRLMDALWLEYRETVGESRNLSVSLLDSLAENAVVRRGAHAVEQKLFDGVKYHDEVMALLKEKSGIDKKDELKMVDFYRYARKKSEDKKILDAAKSPNVAVLMAAGDISTSGDGIASNDMVKEIRELRENEKIKAVVLRVNSPGGSALASDEMWRELTLLAEKKTLIVSMGDVAASGGYYISAPAHRIFAKRSTITGSIGVFGVLPYTGKMFNEKLGVTFDYVQTNKHSVMSLNKKMNQDELRIVQEEVDQIYIDFTEIVAKGRNLPLDKVKQIAKGRVWIGEDALNIGLVDEIGGLRNAMDYAAKHAKIDKPIYGYYPKKEKGKFDELLLAIVDDEGKKGKLTHSPLGKEALKAFEMMKTVSEIHGVQMRLPFFIEIK